MGEETEFSSESHYAETMVNAVEWHEHWNRFERSLMTEARFFSRSAAEFLSRIFGHIDTLKAVPHRPVVVLAGPGRKVTHLYRARVFQTDAKLLEALCRPDKHLGSPPPRLAGAGRMNAQGISVFYGATSTATSLAEVRPPVGSMVAVARFEIVRQLSLLDLTALTDVVEFGSIFDPDTKERVERVAFLRTLPPMPMTPETATSSQLLKVALTHEPVTRC
jgi:hypothetical protein